MTKNILFILLLVSTCYNAQKKAVIPLLDNKPEKFDLHIRSNELAKKIKTKVYITDREDSFHVNDKDGKTLISYNRSYDVVNQKFAFSGYDYSQNPLFGVYRQFYPNNILKEKGRYCWFGFKIGDWYHYDEDGKLISVENTDQGFDFTYKMLLNYCKQNKIPLEKREEGGFVTSIFKTVKENTSLWIIRYFGMSDSDPTRKVDKFIMLDGKTGKTVEKGEHPLPVDCMIKN